MIMCVNPRQRRGGGRSTFGRWTTRAAFASLAVVLVLSVSVGVVQARRRPVELIIDTDPGVDDAAALAWLLSQRRYPVEVLGIVSVAGNKITVRPRA